MLFHLFPKAVPGWCFYFKLKPFDFVLCIPFIIVLGRTSNSYNVFTDGNRSGISFALDHLSFNWKGETLFFWDFAKIFLGEHIPVVVKPLPGAATYSLSDGIWSGYPAIVGYRRRHLRTIVSEASGFVLTVAKDKELKPEDAGAITRTAFSLDAAIRQYRAADLLFAMLEEDMAKVSTER